MRKVIPRPKTRKELIEVAEVSFLRVLAIDRYHSGRGAEYRVQLSSDMKREQHRATDKNPRDGPVLLDE